VNAIREGGRAPPHPPMHLSSSESPSLEGIALAYFATADSETESDSATAAFV
jgi:hypothetical protein